MLSRLYVRASCKVLLNANVVLQDATCKFSHVAHRVRNVSHRNSPTFNFHKHSTAISGFSIRHQSTVTEAVTRSPLSDIPEPPSPQAVEIAQTICKFHENGEPTFESIGLGGYTPVGLIETCLEYFHIGLDLPWWGTIALGTLCVRMAIFPLVIISQRNAAKMNNHLPQMQEIQLQMTEARQSGNQYEAAMYGQELVKFWKDKGISPMKNFIVAITQAPIFISFFIALRKMATVPVESLKEGGLWTFMDLTVPDPYYALPIFTCITLFLTIEIGTDSASASMLGMMKYFLRAMPIVMFPFIMNFPSAILCYWASTNFISLVQVGALKIPQVRTFFKIPAVIKHKKSDLPAKQKTFVEGVKDSWTNVKIAQQLADRDRADALQFSKAAKAPLKRTFKFDPTKQIHDVNSVMAKKR